jgi:phytoene synthase
VSTPSSAAVRDFARVLAAGSKSFALAARLLPRDVRDDAVVLYAFCRRADDAIDLAAEADRPAALARLHADLDAVYGDVVPDDPLLCAMRDVVRRRAIPEAYPRELAHGMAMDVARAAYPTFDALLVYCFRVAGTVGLMMCHVMGVRDPRALRHAAHLGIAMQLTNVCRDVREDAERGRVYVPASVLAASDGALPGAIERLLAEAERFYRSADAGLFALSFRCALAVRTARLVYAAIGRVLAARRFDPLAGRAVVSTGHKLRLVARATAHALGEIPGRARSRFRAAPLGAVVRFPHDVLPV